MEAGLCGSRRGYCVRWQEEMVPRIRRLFFSPCSVCFFGNRVGNKGTTTLCYKITSCIVWEN